MADHKLKGILGSGDKSPNHGSSGSQSPLQKRIADLESVVQRLQKQMAINDDPMATKTFMEVEGDESFDEGTVTSWIGLIPSNVSLNIMIPPSGKR